MPHSFNQLRLAFALVLMTLALSFSLITPPAEAATFEVCATCTYTTVSDAVSAAAVSGDASDTILIHPGTYTESGTISINGLDITITGISTNPAETIIQADANRGVAGYRVFTIAGGGSANVTIENVTIQHGNTAGSGGGIFVGSTNNVTLENVIVARNNAAGGGGGIDNEGTLTILNSRISDNIAAGSDGGGGILNGETPSTNGTLTVTASTIDTNIATTGNGGGIHNVLGDTTIINSTLSTNNTGNAGGAIFNVASVDVSTSVEFSTLSGNTALSFPGVFNDGGGTTSSLTFTSSILTNHGGSDCGFSFVTGSSNYLADDASCTGRIGAVTNFDITLADNGGPTQTHALLSLSNAIDAATACPPSGTDQRGAARPYNGFCDIGAFEVRESITQGSCGGSALTGMQIFDLDGGTVTIEIPTLDDGNGLTCITVEEMGADHSVATTPIQTGNWWRITGDVTSDLNVTVTLPYSGAADGTTRACRWPGNIDGYGWNCGDGSNNTAPTTNSVRRTGVDSFSDWAVGQGAGPTAVTLSQSNAASNPTSFPWLLLSLLTLLTAVVLQRQFSPTISVRMRNK